LNRRFDDQQVRIDTIKEIAGYERKNIYQDIVNLIDDQERFTLDNLLSYSTSEWLAKRNPVLVKFIETLIYSESENQHENEKLFKCSVAVDAVYGARNLRYVSAINLMASAVKYSLSKSKTIVNMDNHILSSGSFTKFIKWQENLAGEAEPLPKGLLFMAFDNEQKGQKNYLDRNYNTVTYHIVTSFISFNFDPDSQIQALEDPWLHESLDSSQIQELFDITPGMHELLDQQLCDYLSTIISEASIEKNKDINTINDLVAKYNTKTGKIKWCDQCGMKEIENLKRRCPQCNALLPLLADFQKKEQEISQETSEKNATKPLNIKFHQIEKETPDVNISSISVTQKSVPDEGVNTPHIFIPDPLLLNPNSIANVRKVLDHIQEISGINKQERKWIAVVCDGVPYHHAQTIKKEYPGIILLPGALHEEMNMLKAFVELNWYVLKK